MAGRLYLEDQGLSITAKAIETISGGQIVRTAVSGANVLTASNAFGDIVEVQLADASADTSFAVGVAVNTGVSGDYIGVATAGVHGLYASAAVTAGSVVFADSAVASADAVACPTASTSGDIIHFGKALTHAASGQLVAVLLK